VPQYVEIRSPDMGLPDIVQTRWVILAAAFLGRTRLIDNLFLSI
jgi:pantoate--beta-alanine ligase